jgi:hypothetical protein
MAAALVEEIPYLKQNLKDDYHFKKIPYKIVNTIFIQHTHKAVLCFFLILRCTAEPSSHHQHEPNKNNSNLPSYFFQTPIFTLFYHLPSGASCSGFLSKLCITPFSPYACYMTHMYHLSSANYVNIW